MINQRRSSSVSSTHTTTSTSNSSLQQTNGDEDETIHHEEQPDSCSPSIQSDDDEEISSPTNSWIIFPKTMKENLSLPPSLPPTVTDSNLNNWTDKIFPNTKKRTHTHTYTHTFFSLSLSSSSSTWRFVHHCISSYYTHTPLSRLFFVCRIAIIFSLCVLSVFECLVFFSLLCFCAYALYGNNIYSIGFLYCSCMDGGIWWWWWWRRKWTLITWRKWFDSERCVF